MKVRVDLKGCRRGCCARRWLIALAMLGLLLHAVAAVAQGGPPFRTDDPETPGNRHWEINFGWVGDRDPAMGAYQVPDFDLNYGLGDRIQLKYELPIAIEETRPPAATAGVPAQTGQVIGGLGQSLLGIKWRFFEHHPGDLWGADRFGTGLLPLLKRNTTTKPSSAAGASSESEDAESVVDLSISTYPQLFLSNPTRAVRRGLVAPGPDFFLPVEVNARLGPVRVDGEVGYSFGNRTVPQSWDRGLLVGHEWTARTETYAELYDQQDANRIAAGNGIGQFATGMPKQRETTLGLGGRHALNGEKTLNLLLMAGRSFQAVSASSNQPSWIAYVGLQVLLGPKEAVTPQVEQKLPDEGRH